MNQQPKPIPILFVHSSDELYGSDRVLLQLVSQIDRTKFEPIVVLPSDVSYKGVLNSLLTSQGITSHSIKMGVLRRRYFTPVGFITYLSYTVYGVCLLVSLIKRYQIRLVHSNTSAVWGGAFAAFICRLPHVWHIHEIIDEPSWMAIFIYKLVLKMSSSVVTVSSAVADHIRKIIPSNTQNLQTIWNGVDCDIFSPEADGQSYRRKLDIRTENILVGVVGRISYRKGQKLFLTAMDQALQVLPQLRGVIVGDPITGEENWLEKLAAHASELGIADKVHFIPFCKDIPQLMRALDILVSPSILPESLGLTILEAMASERPVIASAHGGPLQIIKSGETGFLFPPSNPTALADTIVQLAQSSTLRKSVGLNARTYVIENFSLSSFQRGFEDLYSELLSTTKR